MLEAPPAFVLIRCWLPQRPCLESKVRHCIVPRSRLSAGDSSKAKSVQNEKCYQRLGTNIAKSFTDEKLSSER